LEKVSQSERVSKWDFVRQISSAESCKALLTGAPVFIGILRTRSSYHNPEMCPKVVDGDGIKQRRTLYIVNDEHQPAHAGQGVRSMNCTAESLAMLARSSCLPSLPYVYWQEPGESTQPDLVTL